MLGFLDSAFAPIARSVSAAGGLGDLEILVSEADGRAQVSNRGNHPRMVAAEVGSGELLYL
jgi:hypothetical protein